jgi:hypothetical protein
MLDPYLLLFHIKTWSGKTTTKEISISVYEVQITSSSDRSIGWMVEIAYSDNPAIAYH